MAEKKLIVLDFEMNPVDKSNKPARKLLVREIIQIGAVRLNEELKVVDKFSCYVKPQFNKNITAYITGLTGISDFDTYNAVCFKTALERFAAWMGDSADTVIYSWSDADLTQIKTECEFKHLPLPENMKTWVDLQALYAEKMYGSEEKRKIALHTAAEQFGINMNNGHIHSALYDAEVTAQLLVSVLNGEYINQADILRKTVLKEPEDRGCSIGDCCGSVLLQFLNQMKSQTIAQGDNDENRKAG